MKEFYPEKYSKLEKEFFLQPTAKVAKELPGKILVRETNKGTIAGKIVETEAYIPDGDPANHSTVAQTERNAAMREEGGILYVYKIYGVHHCVNIVTEQKGKGCAVLLRALEPVEGVEIMKKNRGNDKFRDLCRGPGNLAKAFGLTTEHNFASVLNGEFYLLDNKTPENDEIIPDVRIGISKAADLELRYYLKNCNFVSGKKKG